MLHIYVQPVNYIDADYWYKNADYQKALELDPINHFSYYRAYITKTKNPDEKIVARAKALLHQYEWFLAHNIHYTAFSDNPEEAAKLYEFFGDRAKATAIRQLATTVKTAYSEANNFNKQLVPRTMRELFFE